MRDKVRAARPEWSRTLETLRRSLHLNQSELGKKLETSAMTVSRWECAQADPGANAYIRLGKLAGDPLCWFFWGTRASARWMCCAFGPQLVAV